MVKKTLKTALFYIVLKTLLNSNQPTNLFSLRFRHRAGGGPITMAISNIHDKFGKDRACSSGDTLADRQTHRRAHHNTSQVITMFKMFTLSQVAEGNEKWGSKSKYLTKSGGSKAACGQRTRRSGGSTDPLDPVAPRTVAPAFSHTRGDVTSDERLL